MIDWHTYIFQGKEEGESCLSGSLICGEQCANGLACILQSEFEKSIIHGNQIENLNKSTEHQNETAIPGNPLAFSSCQQGICADISSKIFGSFLTFEIVQNSEIHY